MKIDIKTTHFLEITEKGELKYAHLYKKGERLIMWGTAYSKSTPDSDIVEWAVRKVETKNETKSLFV